MIVKDVIEMLKISSLVNLSVARDDAALIKFVNLGVSELYRRFNLSTKIETVMTNSMLALYELRNPDVSLLLTIYDDRGRELMQTDILNGHHDYKFINYKTFLVSKPKDGLLFAVYKACSRPLRFPEDWIDLPDVMMEALLSYVAYLGHSTINRDSMGEASAFAQRFEKNCIDLENQGYKIPINNEAISLMLKGFR